MISHNNGWAYELHGRAIALRANEDRVTELEENSCTGRWVGSQADLWAYGVAFTGWQYLLCVE